jgi:hypothetical protein
MPESGTYGSVRGALSNERPYRDFGLLAMTVERFLPLDAESARICKRQR